MKTFTKALFFTLLIACCFLLTACKQPCEINNKHHFDSNTGICSTCKKTRCELGQHNFNGSKCTRCGESRVVEEQNSSGKSCKDGGNHYYLDSLDGKCGFCNKTRCEAEGHEFYKGYCRHCEKTTMFHWVYDVFDKPDIAIQPKDKEISKFWQAVLEGLATIGFMLAITVGCSLVFWFGAAFHIKIIRWAGHTTMLIMTFGSLIMWGWIWAIVKFLIFDGAYFVLVGGLLSGRYALHDDVF